MLPEHQFAIFILFIGHGYELDHLENQQAFRGLFSRKELSEGTHNLINSTFTSSRPYLLQGGINESVSKILPTSLFKSKMPATY